MSSSNQSPSDKLAEAQLQLIDCLLAVDESAANYPWNPAEPAAAEYYLETDRHFSLDSWSDTEIAHSSQAFFAKIQSCWANSPSPELELSPLAALMAKFGARVPQQWLAQIAANVSRLVPEQLEPIDHLVQSVQDLLPNWMAEDLLVIARPYAYAMRGDTGVEHLSNIVRPLDWDQLSELERAKLTIAIAQVAINGTTVQLDDSTNK
jgi:hypothetical protein